MDPLSEEGFTPKEDILDNKRPNNHLVDLSNFQAQDPHMLRYRCKISTSICESRDNCCVFPTEKLLRIAKPFSKASRSVKDSEDIKMLLVLQNVFDCYEDCR